MIERKISGGTFHEKVYGAGFDGDYACNGSR